MEAAYSQCDVNSNMKKSTSNGSARKDIKANVLNEKDYSDDESPYVTTVTPVTIVNKLKELTGLSNSKEENFLTESYSFDWKKLFSTDETLLQKLNNYISDKIKLYIRDKYVRYLNLTQEERYSYTRAHYSLYSYYLSIRDFSKTGYTYADSWSYNENNRSWDWEIPNMSRMSLASFRKKQRSSTISVSQTTDHLAEEDNQSSSSSTAAVSEFAIPSTPVRNVKRNLSMVRDSPFTRSQCRGGVVCQAQDCEIHKKTRHRQSHKSSQEGTRIAYSGMGLEPSDNFINEERERDALFDTQYGKMQKENGEDYDIFEHHKTVYFHRNTREYYDQVADANGPIVAAVSRSEKIKSNLAAVKKTISSVTVWRYWPLFLICALCLFTWQSGLITSDNLLDITSRIASHSTLFSATKPSFNSHPPKIDAKSLEDLKELQEAMHSMKEQLSRLTLELQAVKQEGLVSQDNYNSLRASLEDLNKKFNNCCRNETELISFVNANLISMLSNAQSPEGKVFSSLLRNFVQIEMQNYVVPESEIDNKINQTVDFVMQRLERLKAEMQDSVNDISSNMQTGQSEKRNSNVEVSIEDVKKLIREALFVYDADKTGIPDYALESSGGSVIDIRCSETFDPYGIQYKIFGIPVWSTSNSPRAVIQPTITPGDCWAFKGSQGYLVIKLSKMIVPTSFSYEHIPKQISRDGNINSAPREFQVRGLKDETDTEGELLGSYTYEDNGMPLQNFAVTNPNPKPYKFIELVITSNHGHDEYTCLYRFRVHGKPIHF